MKRRGDLLGGGSPKAVGENAGAGKGEDGDLQRPSW